MSENSMSNNESSSLLTIEANSANLNTSLKWCLNSGTTSHLSNDISDFTVLENTINDKLNLANSETTKIVSKGTASFNADIFGNSNNIISKNVLFVPELTYQYFVCEQDQARLQAPGTAFCLKIMHS